MNAETLLTGWILGALLVAGYFFGRFHQVRISRRYARRLEHLLLEARQQIELQQIDLDQLGAGVPAGGLTPDDLLRMGAFAGDDPKSWPPDPGPRAYDTGHLVQQERERR